jgi:sugar phosphate isomerase/epimerase
MTANPAVRETDHRTEREVAPSTWHAYAAKVPFRLGVVSTELGDDLQRVCTAATSLGIQDLELHTLWGRQVTDLTDDDARRARDVIRAHGLRTCLITGPAFKAAPLESIAPAGECETRIYQEHRQTLEREVALARLFGTDRVRVFSFARPRDKIGAGVPGGRPSPELGESELETLRRGFAPLVGLAEREGVTLMLENVRSCYADTGLHSRQILAAIDSPRVRLIWDPANAFVSGEAAACSVGYDAVRPYVAQVHAKDAAIVDPSTGETEWRRIGDGAMDWTGQLRALLADGYAGVVSLETHWRLAGDSGERSTAETWRGLATCLDRALGVTT